MSARKGVNHSKDHIIPFLAGLAVLAFLLYGCGGVTIAPEIPSQLDPRGPAAADINALWWILFGLGTAVFVMVTAVLLYVVYSRWRLEQQPAERAPDLRRVSGTGWIVWGGVVIPFVILMVVVFFATRSLAFHMNPPAPSPLTIEVIGQMWWWEVRYPEFEFVTANEIHIPVGQPVEVRLTSRDVIHSFWIPQLQGKQDMTPGRIDSIWLQADEAGVYRGLCAEFCGLQHSKMHFIVVAEPADQFDDWLEQQRQPAPSPDNELARRGQQLFLESSCIYCHTIRGTDAIGDVGPDLTHLISRRTLGAGILDNTPGNLAGWIVDPQHFKPGNLMPPTNLDSDDLQALLTYLDTLE